MSEDSPRYNLRRDFVNISGACRVSASRSACLLLGIGAAVVGVQTPHPRRPRSPMLTTLTPAACAWLLLAAASSLSVVIYEQPGMMDALKSIKIPFLQKVGGVSSTIGGQPIPCSACSRFD